MVGKPPLARLGTAAALAGRPIVAGVAPFERLLSPRASDSDLWAGIQSTVVSPIGFRRTEKMHRVKLDRNAEARAAAFVNQAHQYFGTIASLGPVAKPLVAYYFILNLTKAFLTLTDPGTTKKSFMHHGLSQSFTQGQRYSFKRERLKIADRGVFRLLAERTGIRHCWSNGHQLGFSDLMPYLADGYSSYSDAESRAPKLLPIGDVQAMFRNQRGWLSLDIDRNALRQRNEGVPLSGPGVMRLLVD